MSTILIGENIPDITDLLITIFRRTGHQLHTTRDGDALLTRARHLLPDLIIMNPALPGLDGLDVCRHLRSEPATEDLPIMMISARQAPADMRAPYDAGADGYVGKPFDPAHLLDIAHTLIKRPEAGSTWQA
jgi:DNA-binding response OmpR family regulator